MPTSYNAAQRSSISQFVQFTNTKDSVATKFLKAAGWNLDAAVEAFYSSGQSNTAATHQTLSKLFDKFRDDPKSFADRIGVEGMSNYLTELSVRPDEVVCLGLMELLSAPTIGELHREPFIKGWLHTPPPPNSNSHYATPQETITKQAAYAKQLRTAIQTDPATFRRVYRYTFNICRPEGQKNVPADVATEMWRLFFSPDNGGISITGSGGDSGTPWLEWWIEFYESQYKRPVNKDLWNMFGEMVGKLQEEETKGIVIGGGTDADAANLKAGFGWWSEDGAWPGAIDEFVEFVVKKRKEGGMEVE